MTYYYPAHRPTPAMHMSNVSAAHPHSVTSTGRPRRGARFASTQHAHRPFRGVRSMKELTEAASVAAFRARYEAGRSFDLDDDLEFCPALLTQDDLHDMSSPSSSDRSSFSSNSPDASPMPHQVQPTPALTPSPPSMNYSMAHPSAHFQAAAHAKLHQPAAVRTRNAIPIVNPSTGMRLPSRPQSVSPGLNGGLPQRRW